MCYKESGVYNDQSFVCRQADLRTPDLKVVRPAHHTFGRAEGQMDTWKVMHRNPLCSLHRWAPQNGSSGANGIMSQKILSNEQGPKEPPLAWLATDSTWLASHRVPLIPDKINTYQLLLCSKTRNSL